MSALLATDQKIKELCIRTGEPGFHNYSTMQGFMLSAIRDLNIYSLPSWSVATLPITTFNTVSWTCDCVKPLVTALKRNGCYYLLSVSEDLLQTLNIDPVNNPVADTECAVEDLFSIDGFLEAYGWTIWSWGLGELYGAQTLAPPFGLVIHDKKNRRSFIKNVCLQTGDEVTMFFKSSGMEDCPQFIPSEAEQVVEYFMLMKWYESRNPGIADRMEENYKQRLFRLDRFNSDGDEDQWTRAMYSNVKSSPKF